MTRATRAGSPSHLFHRPKGFTALGASRARTIETSTRTAAARGVPTGCSRAIDPATKRTNTIGRRRDRPTRTLYGPLDRADAAVYESLGDAELEAMRRVLRGTCEVDERHAVWLRELGTPSEGG